MKTTRMFLCAALAAVCLAGCAATSGSSPPGTPVAGDAAARTVFATRSAYAGALAAAVAYRNLPACTAHAQPCSKPEVVAQLQKADTAAGAALDAAEAAVRTPSIGTSAQDKAIGAASAALAAMNALVTSLGVLQ